MVEDLQARWASVAMERWKHTQWRMVEEDLQARWASLAMERWKHTRWRLSRRTVLNAFFKSS